MSAIYVCVYSVPWNDEIRMEKASEFFAVKTGLTINSVN